MGILKAFERRITAYTVEWLDWDYRTHKTVYRPKGQNCYDWSDKRQIRSSQRGKVRQILQRFEI